MNFRIVFAAETSVTMLSTRYRCLERKNDEFNNFVDRNGILTNYRITRKQNNRATVLISKEKPGILIDIVNVF